MKRTSKRITDASLRTATLGLAIVVLVSGCATREASRKPTPADAAYQWLCAQQGTHGILGNQDGESFAGLYPNAMAAIAFLEQGDRDRCERVLDFYEAKRKSDLLVAPGGFPQFYDAATGATMKDSDRWMGDNCWLLIALNHHEARTGSKRYCDMANEIADWLEKLQDADGGMVAGFNKSGPMNQKSTEGNLDAYAALTFRPDVRRRVGQWLWKEMWLPQEGRFRMGSTDNNPALDTSAWGVLALGRSAWPAMVFARKNLSRMKTMDATGVLVDGYTDFVDKDRVWLEGTGEMACAYQAGGATVHAEHVIRELEKAMVPSQAHPGTLGIPCHSNDPAWEGGSTKAFVPSVCWYLFAKWKFNPMQGFTPR